MAKGRLSRPRLNLPAVYRTLNLVLIRNSFPNLVERGSAATFRGGMRLDIPGFANLSFHDFRFEFAMSTWNLSAVESAFAEAALDASKWTQALETVASTTESHGAILLPVKGGFLRTLPFTDSMSGPFDSFVRDGWHLRDERNRGIPLMQKFGVVDDLDIFSPDRIASLPYYQEFLAPHGLRWFAGVGVFFEDDVWCLSIQRRIDQSPFSTAEKTELAKLSRSLATAAATARLLGEAATSGAMEAYSARNMAAVLIDRYGKIFEANSQSSFCPAKSGSRTVSLCTGPRRPFATSTARCPRT